MDINDISNIGNFGLSIVLVIVLLRFFMTTIKNMVETLVKQCMTLDALVKNIDRSIDHQTEVISELREIKSNILQIKEKKVI